jgi:predicted PhzF superfamily epimerase YddE/YHI9
MGVSRFPPCSRPLALRPDFVALADLAVGVVGAWKSGRDGGDAQFEVRAFAMSAGVGEDPVTGSLNAGLAQWLMSSGHAAGDYVASKGTALRRAGRVHVEQAGGEIWIGGATVTYIEGTVSF